jgi:phosphoglucomutase/phosphomannomutase
MLMPQIRDKDAAAGCLLLAELALFQKRRGLNVGDYLDSLNREFGYFRNEVKTVFMTGILGKKQMGDMLNSLRTSPPSEIGGMKVTSFEDLLREDSRLGPLQGDTDKLARNFLIFRLGEQAKIVLRPSGTEPKAKAYFEVSSPPCPTNLRGDEWCQRCQAVDDQLLRLTDDFMRLALGRVGMKP